MSVKTKAAPALQERSRETLQKLLAACTEVLEKDGLEGATIPRIAKKAGVAAGSVYRRFPDKDALLQETFAQLVEQAHTANRAKLNPVAIPAVSLKPLARSVVRGIVTGFRQHPGLLRSLIRYLHQNPNAAFKRHMDQMQRETFEQLCVLLLRYRDEIGHPDPDFAVRFGLLTVVSTAQNVVVLGADEIIDTEKVSPRLEEQLTRAFLAYLQVENATADAIKLPEIPGAILK
jgi:AcrR family transcriptional regulator